MRIRICTTPCLLVAVQFFAIRSMWAAEIHVDNRAGSDAFDGSAIEPQSNGIGPVRTLRRALKLAKAADTVVLVNRGVPYYETLQLVGSQHSGTASTKFSIVGNGAVISGATLVPSRGWRKVGTDLWRLTPLRKGHFQLLQHETPVPEHRYQAGTTLSGQIPPGHWCVWRGSVYFKTAALEDPRKRRFSLASHDVGLTLFGVHDVRVVDVTFRHFRLDGINAHDLCRNVVIENVKSTGNGRAGLSVGGSSHVVVRNCELVDNRTHSLLISELGGAELLDTQVSEPPTFKK